MAGTFKFELVSPEKMLIPLKSEDPRKVAVAEAEQVIVPGSEGQFTVLAGHAPVLTALRPGVIEIKLATGLRRVFVRGGFAEVEPARLTILAQRVVDLDDKDELARKLGLELTDAQAALSEAKDDAQRMIAKDAIDQLRGLAGA